MCKIQEVIVLHYAIIFFVIALIAALFGFSGIAAGATWIAKLLLVVFLILAVVMFVWGWKRKIFKFTVTRDPK